MPVRNLKIDEGLRKDLAHRYILYRVIEERDKVPVLLEGNDIFLEEFLDQKFGEYWTIEEGQDYYSPTPKGELIYQNFIARWWDFLLTYDVFAGVDLQEGVFADEDAHWNAVDSQGRPIWEDLRVAVCIHKKRLAEKNGLKTDLNPFTIAFLSLLSEKRIGLQEAWQYDLASGGFWQEVEEIVNTNLWPEDLGYRDDETGEEVPWEAVIEDIIQQGIEETQRRWEEEDEEEDEEYLYPPEGLTSRQQVVEEYEEEITSYGWDYDPFYYNPYAVLAGGLLTVGFIAAVWAIL
jgi:hypothetical protein